LDRLRAGLAARLENSPENRVLMLPILFQDESVVVVDK